MEEYLKPAGYEFQKVQRDHKRLLEGRELLDRDLPQEITACKNNNERHEILERYYNALPLYDYNYLESESNTIVELIDIAISSAKNTNPIEIETPFGPMEGKTYKDILAICLSIIDFIRFTNVEFIFDYLIKLYISCTDSNEKKLIEKSIVTLAKYNINVLQLASFYVQETVLNYLEKLDYRNLISAKEILIKICSCILDTSIESTSSNYKSITIRHGSIPGNEHAAKLRNRALTLLFNNFSPDDHNNIKQQVISALNIATRTPSMSTYSDELLALILKDSTTIVNFYTSIIPNEQYPMLKSIEADVYSLYRIAIDIVKGSRFKNEICLKSCEELSKKAIKFRDKLNKNNEYVAYKTLVGYESVFNEFWNDNEFELDFSAKNEYRESQMQSYIDNFVTADSGFWEKVTIQCAETESNDLASFPVFGKFLNLLSIKHPKFVFNLVNKHEDVLMRFSCAILDGLLKTDMRWEALTHMINWVDQGKFLTECAAVLYHIQFEKDLLIKILDAAINHSDTSALAKLILVSAIRFNSQNKSTIDLLFLPVLKELTKLKDARWVSEFQYRVRNYGIIAELKENEINILLENLVLLEKIDFAAEEILATIAKTHPMAILDFFKRRLELREESIAKRTKTFEAIPFSFHCLNKPLAVHLNLVIDTICNWYKNDFELFTFRGAKLVAKIFPDLSPELENKLGDLVTIGNEENILIVLAILRHYHNDRTMRNAICKKIVRSLPEDSMLLQQVATILKHTGVVCGEFGLVNALEQIKEQILPWASDQDEKLKIFANKFTVNIDKEIIFETRRAEEGIELQKHLYGE